MFKQAISVRRHSENNKVSKVSCFDLGLIMESSGVIFLRATLDEILRRAFHHPHYQNKSYIIIHIELLQS